MKRRWFALLLALAAGLVVSPPVSLRAGDAEIVRSPVVTGVSRTGDGLRLEWIGNAGGRFQLEAAESLGDAAGQFAPISPELEGFRFVDTRAFARQRYYRVVDLTLKKPFETASGRVPRAEAQLQDGELAALASGNSDFALAFYRQLAQDPGLAGANLFASPYSISLAFAMTYAGAGGDTAAEMAGALGFDLPPERVHEAFNGLAKELAGRGAGIADPADRFQLNIVNETWGQTGYTFLGAYLDTLARHYGAAMNLLDFRADAAAARIVINDWVEKQTNDRIQDLMPDGSVTADTRLVLTNAIYFKAKWQDPFGKDRTATRPFTLASGAEAPVDTMTNRWNYPVAKGSGYTAVELPYKGEELSMIVIAPDAGQFDAFERNLTAAQVSAVAGKLRATDVELSLPKFQFATTVPLKAVMTELGMRKAFSAGEADFSGISAQDDLYIQSAIHKAFVAVDEEGTEAAAATGISVGVTSLPEPIRIDRPFVFLIRDRQTGTILFLGRVMNPGG